MKKTYVKPVMESEEFVANEYVAACWRFTCEGGGTGVYKTDNEKYEPTEKPFDGDLFFKLGNLGWGYIGKVEECTKDDDCGIGFIFGELLFEKELHSLKEKPQRTNAS